MMAIKQPPPKLTHSRIDGAKPKSKPYKLSDTDRLYVLITKTGKKYWKWNYRLHGKDCTYTLGTFPDLKLSDARIQRGDAEKHVAQGIHPADADRELVIQNKADKAATFWSVAEEWITDSKSNWSKYYILQVESIMHRYARDADFGERPISKITPSEVYNLLKSVANRTERKGSERKDTGAPTVAILLRQLCNAVFRRAVVSGRAERNPVADLKASDVITRPKVKNNLALKRDQLHDLLKSLTLFTGQRTTGIAIELLMLTFLRTGELRMATWAEIDLDNARWTIPASRMKIKDAGDHVVPLSKQAVRLLKELKEITGTPLLGFKNWLFPNYRSESDCMSATTVNRALERMGYNGKGTIGFSGHGFRGTASTLLHEMGFRPDIIECQLAHQDGNAVKAAYNKARYIPERTIMLQFWADFLDGLKKGETVPPPKNAFILAIS